MTSMRLAASLAGVGLLAGLVAVAANASPRFFEPASPKRPVAITPIASQQAEDDSTARSREAAEAIFLAEVLPIFEARCVECHGADRAKAGLRLH